MSYSDGMSAINLEMPLKILRTEYSAKQHHRTPWQETPYITSRFKKTEKKIRLT